MEQSFPPHQSITLTNELGKGGEATVYNIAEDKYLVAKIYHQPTSDREAKLHAMLFNPPEQPTTHVAIAWPTALIYQHMASLVTWSTLETLEATNLGQFVGFLMPKITAGYSLFHIYNPVLRKKLPYPFDRKALHRTAYNLCAVVAKIHAKGYVIGDINESNILVNQKALVTIVDCDSFQVTSEGGHIHRCQVGKPEYTPPELQGTRLSEVDQTIQHDLFGLAVLLFQLLMEGYHPFTGVLQTPQSVGRVDLYAIREGLFPYTNPSRINPPPSAPPYEWLHGWLQKAFQRCFMVMPQYRPQRPTARQWQEVLQQAEKMLQQCSNQNHHYFANHLLSCPFCETVSATQAVYRTNQQASANIKVNDIKQMSITKQATHKTSEITHHTNQQIPSGIIVQASGRMLRIKRQFENSGEIRDISAKVISVIISKVVTVLLTTVLFMIGFSGEILPVFFWMCFIVTISICLGVFVHFINLEIVLTQKQIVVNHGLIQFMNQKSFSWADVHHLSVKFNDQNSAYVIYLNDDITLIDHLSKSQAKYIIAELNKFQQQAQSSQLPAP